MRKLVVYFSKAGEQWLNGGLGVIEVGNTEKVAKMIADIEKADIFKVETVKDYPQGYYECCDVAKEELQNKDLPELKEYLPSISGYDVIYIGYPCWWGTYPRAIATFLSKYDFNGKKICPFCTHEGSGMGNSERDLRANLPTAEVQQGLAIRGHLVDTARQNIKNWIDSLN